MRCYFFCRKFIEGGAVRKHKLFLYNLDQLLGEYMDNNQAPGMPPVEPQQPLPPTNPYGGDPQASVDPQMPVESQTPIEQIVTEPAPQPVEQPAFQAEVQPQVSQQPAPFASQAPPVTPPVSPVASFDQTVEPQPSPMQPVGQPVFSGGVMQSVPTSPTSGLGKKLGLIIGAIVGVLAIVAVAVFAMSAFGVSRADYSEAVEATGNMSTAYSSLAVVYVSPYSTETEIKNSLDTMKNNQKKFEEKFTELGKLRAMKSDKDIKAEYKKLVDKKPKFDAALDAAFESYEKVLPLVSSVNSSTGSTSEGAAVFADLRMKFEGVSGLEHDVNKTFVSSMAEVLKEIEAAATKVAEGRADRSKYDSNAVTQLYDSIDKMRDITSDWTSNLNKLADDGELRDEISSLFDALSKKIREK